jgi:hypothetical protein
VRFVGTRKGGLAQVDPDWLSSILWAKRALMVEIHPELHPSRPRQGFQPCRLCSVAFFEALTAAVTLVQLRWACASA